MMELLTKTVFGIFCILGIDNALSGLYVVWLVQTGRFYRALNTLGAVSEELTGVTTPKIKVEKQPWGIVARAAGIYLSLLGWSAFVLYATIMWPTGIALSLLGIAHVLIFLVLVVTETASSEFPFIKMVIYWVARGIKRGKTIDPLTFVKIRYSHFMAAPRYRKRMDTMNFQAAMRGERDLVYADEDEKELRKRVKIELLDYILKVRESVLESNRDPEYRVKAINWLEDAKENVQKASPYVRWDCVDAEMREK